VTAAAVEALSSRRAETSGHSLVSLRLGDLAAEASEDVLSGESVGELVRVANVGLNLLDEVVFVLGMDHLFAARTVDG
jgi:hypothetical protein